MLSREFPKMYAKLQLRRTCKPHLLMLLAQEHSTGKIDYNITVIIVRIISSYLNHYLCADGRFITLDVL
ncbi:hypothetical protein B5X24_HaOG214074 [Helicoverpa armigera]|nr:hypothetical protein B5X24_HaOG214074 [Helicoverpa armigera]